MTTAQAFERLRSSGYTEEQAKALVGVLEDWEQSRLVTREFLRAELLEVRKELKEMENTITRWVILTGATIILSVVGTTIASVNFLATHYKP